MQAAWVQSLVKELRSYMPCGVAPPKKFFLFLKEDSKGPPNNQILRGGAALKQIQADTKEITKYPTLRQEQKLI